MGAAAYGGCVDGDGRNADVAPAPEAERAPPAAAAEPVFDRSTPWRIEVGASAGSGAGTNLQGDATMRFDIADGAARLEATSQWGCISQNVCRLAMTFMVGNKIVARAEGLSPLVVTVDSPPAGDWSMWIGPSSDGSLVAMAEGTTRVVAT